MKRYSINFPSPEETCDEREIFKQEKWNEINNLPGEKGIFRNFDDFSDCIDWMQKVYRNTSQWKLPIEYSSEGGKRVNNWGTISYSSDFCCVNI